MSLTLQERALIKDLPKARHVPEVQAIVAMFALRIENLRDRLETGHPSEIAGLQGQMRELRALHTALTKQPPHTEPLP